MDHPMAVSMVESKRYFSGDLHRVVDRQLDFALQAVTQALALDVWMVNDSRPAVEPESKIGRI